MPNETGLIATVSVALALAFVGGFVATRLRLPAIVGYLLAGVAVGPFTPGFVANQALAPQLAEIGVILLMFGVGIHFSWRDLLAVRSIAIPGAIAGMTTATALTTAVALWWGWRLEAGLMLGLSISVSSTVVLLRALHARDAMDSPPGRVAVGWLIVEDLLTVLALVLLPVLATSGGAAAVGGANLALTVGLTLAKVAVLVAIMMLVGARLVPWLLVQVARTGSRELFTLAVLAVALGIAFGAATLFGVSLALGAFLAGLVVGESELSHRAAEDALPLRDAFAVLFFVSVGMLVDPAFLLTRPGQVLALLLIIVLGKPLVALLLVVALGRPPRMGLLVAIGLAQIGEFSFILAEMGRTLGLLPEAGQNLVLVGALLSITLNPLLLRAIDPIEAWVNRQPWAPARRTGDDGPAGASPEDHLPAMRGHAVLYGHGRVGRRVGEALERQGVPYLVVDLDRRTVEALRQRGIPALHGDAADDAMHARLGLADARLLVAAIPDPLATRRLIQAARRQNPSLPIVARTHSEAERSHLSDERVDAVLAEREAALAMTRLALRHVGVEPTDRPEPPAVAPVAS